MDELLKQRIVRRLENLPDEKAYQVLDYIEFLDSKFGDRSGKPSTLEKIADRVEDTLRAGRVSVSAIKGTRDVFDAAGRVMQGLADAGKTVVDELQSPGPSSKGKKPSDHDEKDVKSKKEEGQDEQKPADDEKEPADDDREAETA
ncbi:MAG: hypothetical protein O7I93_00185 [Gemmatimonadetes bacterium]|nr:hypothetical protein [Gemmatimonadota bacterium]